MPPEQRRHALNDARRVDVLVLERLHDIEEIAVAVMGPTVVRHIEELDMFYVDIPESHVPRLAKVELTELEKEILEEIVRLHRKDDHFWGRRHVG